MADSLIVRMALDSRNYITGASKAAKANDAITTSARQVTTATGNTATITRRYGHAAESAAKSTSRAAAAQARMAKFSKSTTGELLKFGAGAAVAAGAVKLVGDSVTAFSDLEESINAVNVQFGEGADAILDFGQTAATEVGLANSEFNQLSVVTGALFANFIEDEEEAAQATIKLTQRAADMASVFNTDVNEALIALQASLRGEQEPIRRFGVSMDDMMVKAKAVEMGLADTTGEVTQQAKHLARLEIIYEQTNKTAGDFANTSDSLANRQKTVAASVEDVKAAAGETLEVFAEFGLGVAESLLTAAEGVEDFIRQFRLGSSRIRSITDDWVDAFDIALGPTVNFDIEVEGEADLRSLLEAALNTSHALRDGMEPVQAYGAGLISMIQDGWLPAEAAMISFRDEMGATDAEIIAAVDAILAAGDASGLTADDLEFLSLSAGKFRRATERAAKAAGEGGDAIAGMGVDILSESEALREEAMGYAAAIAARTRFLTKNEPVISSYQRQASAIRDVARAQAEAASPILALLAAQERVRAAQLALTEAQQNSTTTTDELRSAQVDLVGAQGDLEVAAANATENINGGTSAFAELASQAGLTDEEIRAILESLDALPTEVPIHIKFTVTGLPDDIDLPTITPPNRPPPPVPMLHAGGELDAGELSIIGEKGPELWRPRTAGTVIPMGGSETTNAASNTVQVFVDGGTGDVADQVALGLMTTGITEEIEWAGTSTIR